MTGDLVKGEAFLRRAIEADPSNLDAYEMLGGLLLFQGKFDQAVAKYDALAERQPGAVWPPTLATMIRQGQWIDEEARQRYERVVEANPRAAVAANNLAWMYATRGEQLDRAVQLTQAAKAEPLQNPEMNDTLGFAYI